METKINIADKRNNAKKQYIRLVIALIILIGIASIFILYASWPLLTGTKVVLATQPVDPFDIFRGQYITINYEISSPPLISSAQEGDTVYIALAPDAQGIWRYQSASLKPIKNAVAIRGTITSLGKENMRVSYGIEQYFFERNAQFSVQNITVEAKVGKDGSARISRLLQNNKKLEITYQGAGFNS